MLDLIGPPMPQPPHLQERINKEKKKKKPYSMYNIVASSHGLLQELSYLARGLETFTTQVMTWIHI